MFDLPDKPTLDIRHGRSLLQWLVEPSDSVLGPEARRQARLLAALLVILSPLAALGSVYTLFFAPSVESIVPLAQGGAAVCLFGLYLLSRTANYRVASWMVVSFLLAVPFSVALVREGDSGEALLDPFIWSALPILLSGVLLSLRGIILLGVLNVVGLGLLAVTNAEIGLADVGGPLGLVGGLFALTVATTRHRDLLERDRQTRLAERNRALGAIRESLEERVAERTLDLELRARYLEATSAVAREAASMLGDRQALLSRVVDLVSEQFGVYHAGLFLISSTGEWAELQAASSEGGQHMLARRHRLRVGQQGIVGYVAGEGEPRVALDVGEDAMFFDNPDLPETRSEVALPMRARGEIIGVLDVQSTESQAFTEQDARVLQSLTDQVAVAIDNARLLRQVEEGVETERRARGELSREAWTRLLQDEQEISLIGRPGGISTAPETWHPEMEKALRTAEICVCDEDETRLSIPLQVSGQVIGVLEGRKQQERGAWTPEEIEMLESLTEQLSAALERARLYRETQRNVARERTLSEIGARMRASLDMDGLLQTAIRETADVLDASRVFVQWIPPADQEGRGIPDV